MFAYDTLPSRSGPVPIWSGGTGPPLVYLHGAGGFRPTPGLELLTERYRVVALILPGFHETPFVRGVDSMTTLAEWVADVLDAAVGDGPVPVLGHSFGGWLAAWLAVRRPHRLTHLLLEAPAGLNPAADQGPGPGSPEARLYAHPGAFAQNGSRKVPT